MDKTGMFGEILEQGQSAAKSVKKQIADTAKAAASQVAGCGVKADLPDQNQPPGVDKNFVKDLYGIKDAKKATSSQKPTETQSADASKSVPQDQKKLEEKQKLAKLRQELHQTTYYEPLIHPKKEKPEERPAEKLEQEEKKEEFELEQKKAKEPPPLVKKAQQRVEKFPGASG